MTTSAGIVLAAGASQRAGSVKALARLGARSLLSTAIRTLRIGGCTDIIVVTAKPHRVRVARVARAQQCRAVVNDTPERGMLSSVQAGVRALERVDVIVVSLVDHPHVLPATVARLISQVRSGAAVAIPTYAGAPGHPFACDWATSRALLAAAESQTTREVLEAGEHLHHVSVEDAAVLEDLDTPESLRKAGVVLDTASEA